MTDKMWNDFFFGATHLITKLQSGTHVWTSRATFADKTLLPHPGFPNITNGWDDGWVM